MTNAIALPDPVIFTTTIPVQIFNINYGNHLGHDSMVSLLHEARIRFLKSHNVSEGDIDNCFLVVQALNVVYKKEVLYGEQLTFKLGLGAVGKARAEMLTLVCNEKQKEVCRASVTLVFMDRETKRIVSPPKLFCQ